MKHLCSAMAVTLALTAPAMATPVSVTETLTGVARGASVDVVFDTLAPSDVAGGTLTLIGQGLDLGRGSREYMDITVEGVSLGSYVCDVTPRSGSTHIAGSVGNTNCNFTLPISISGSSLVSFLDDGTVNINIDFGPFTNVMGSSDFLTVRLDYNSVAAVPLPAGAVLILSGLTALGIARRRRNA